MAEATSQTTTSPHVVVIGLGSIGRRHARNAVAVRPHCRLTLVRRSGQPDEFSSDLGASVISTIDDIAEPVDLAILATPSSNHIELLPQLIERGWPLLVEKPMVSTAQDCDEIERALAGASKTIRVAGFNLRHLPSLQRLRDDIAANRLGGLVRASLEAGHWLPDWRPGTDYLKSYSAHARLGGGVELDLSHEFDVARWLFGELRVVAASGGRFSDLGLEANDAAVAVLMPLDARGPVVTIGLDYVSRQPVRSYAVVGDRTSLHWDLQGSLVSSSPEGRTLLKNSDGDFDLGATYSHMLTSLFRAIESGDANGLQSLSDGIASTRLAIAARDIGSSQ